MSKWEVIENKVYPAADHPRFLQLLAYWRFKGFTIVFSNGCFDLLHRGHVEYLAKAASLGDVLVVGLNSDESVSRLKGPSRPLNGMESRALVLASLQVVTAVVPFSEDTPISLITLIQPDILVKGADYRPEEIVGYDVVTAKGGRVETIALVDGFSTTTIVNRLTDNRWIIPQK